MTSSRTRQYAFALAALSFLVSTTPAGADNCPPGYSQVGVRREETQDAIILHPKCAPLIQPTARNLATDPDAVRLSGAALRLVDNRIANLKKAIVLLGDDNAEWRRERDQVLEDMREDAEGLSWEGINLVSLGLAEWVKVASASHMDEVRANALVNAMKEPLANLPGEEARLNRIMAKTTEPALTRAILEYESALHRLRDARETHDVVKMAARIREAVEILHDEFELMREKPPTSHEVADELYVSSAIMGRTAMIFLAEGPGAVAVVIGTAVSSGAVGARELVNLWQERRRLAALDRNASDRNSMRVELRARLDGLEQQRQLLTWAIQRAQ
jgi:hypothetical protein